MVRYSCNHSRHYKIIKALSGQSFQDKYRHTKKIEKTQSDKNLDTQTWTKLGHVQVGFLSVQESAQRLNVSIKTVSRWCKSGKLPAIPRAYGETVTYQISSQAIEMYLLNQNQEKSHKKQVEKAHCEMVGLWQKAMAKGLLNGKVFSQRTIDDYLHYSSLFFSKHKQLTVSALKAELMRIPSHQFAKREHYFKAMLCFSKFLIREGYLEELFLENIKPLYPKRHIPPTRLTINKQDLESLLKACKSPLETLIVVLLSSTGLRASEACSLKIEDVDFQNQVLTVRLGKGNKTRRVGLTPYVIEVIQGFLVNQKNKKSSDFLLLDKNGKRMSRNGLYQRLERIGEKAGVEVSPHALRRAFVTINANAGRPLQMLQRACGHSDIKTTMAYCRTSEQEVIDAMKDW